MKRIIPLTLTSIVVATIMQTNTRLIAQNNTFSQITNNVITNDASLENKVHVLQKDVLITAYLPSTSYPVNASEKIANYLHNNYGYDILLLDPEQPLESYKIFKESSKKKKRIISLGVDGTILENNTINYVCAATNGIMVKKYKNGLYHYIKIDKEQELGTIIMTPLIPFSDIYTRLRKSKLKINLDYRPGEDACNYLAYLYIFEALKNSDNVAKGIFIHIKNSSNQEYIENIADAIRYFHD